MEEPLNDVAVPVAPPDKAIVLAVCSLVADATLSVTKASLVQAPQAVVLVDCLIAKLSPNAN